MMIMDAYPCHNIFVWIELDTYLPTRQFPIFYKQNTGFFIVSYQNEVYFAIKIQVLILVFIYIPDTLYSVIIL